LGVPRPGFVERTAHAAKQTDAIKQSARTNKQQHQLNNRAIKYGDRNVNLYRFWEVSCANASIEGGGIEWARPTEKPTDLNSVE
jgi:hypothetical protein